MANGLNTKGRVPMAISRVYREELESLSEEVASLERWYEGQSEAVRIDFRRRYDQAWAVLRYAARTWASIDKVEADFKGSEKSKLPMIVGGLFFVSIVAPWWLWPEHKISFAIAIVSMVYFGGWAVMLQFSAWDLNKQRTMLDMRQDDYLYHWEASGADAREFSTYRDRLREARSEASTESEREEAEKESEAWGALFRHRLRKALFHRASGTREDLLESGECVLERHSW
jgi:hypothetical protein